MSSRVLLGEADDVYSLQLAASELLSSETRSETEKLRFEGGKLLAKLCGRSSIKADSRG
jgi:hypothetical protein